MDSLSLLTLEGNSSNLEDRCSFCTLYGPNYQAPSVVRELWLPQRRQWTSRLSALGKGNSESVSIDPEADEQKARHPGHDYESATRLH